MLSSRRVLLLAAIIICLTLPVQSAVRYVKADSPGPTLDGSSWNNAYHTVTAGISAALSGDEIWVAKGTYVENIRLKAGVGLYGGFAGTETSRSERNWVTNRTCLDGNKAGSVVTAPPGATASTRIDGFTIRNGKASFGGGIYCYSSSPTISNNAIISNTASDLGCGICCIDSASPVISNNTIASNISSSSSGFAGICCVESSSPVISNNTIVANTGIGIYCESCSAKISNNIVAFNSAGISQYDSALTLRNNCVYGNSRSDYSGGISPGPGSISVDPMIIMSISGEAYHIQPNSPCRNAGDNSAPGVPSVDIDGQTRPESDTVDIGDDESYGETWNEPIIYVSPNGNDNNDGFSWASAKKTIKTALYAYPLSKEVWVAAGTYTENITLRNGIALYGGFAGTETSRDQRNWVTNRTILDGNRKGGVVTSYMGDPSTVIDGFTIRNGYASYGGGIYCSSSSPTISNNIIIGNTGYNNGGGIYCDLSSAVISNNTIVSNTSENHNGGGIYCTRSSPIVANNTIVSNSWEGIYCESTSSPAVSNNIVAFNSRGIYQSGGTPELRNNCVYGNLSYNYYGLSAGTGDISMDPMLLASISGIMHVQPTSPCRDAGDSSAPGVPAVDIDGKTRPEGSAVDIGADESYGEAWTPTIMYVSLNGNDNNDGFSWSLAKRTVGKALSSATAGMEVWVARGTYLENITLRSGVALYGGFAGTETSRGERNSATNQTILDGNRYGSVVTSRPETIPSTRIDGFTIHNGYAQYGGGVNCDASSLGISNNIITGNSAGNSGGGIYCTGSPTISNNTIVGNTAIDDGGGIYCAGSSTISNNTIASNTGEGVYCVSSSESTVSNNIIAFNTWGIYQPIDGLRRCNCVYGSTYGNYPSGTSPGSGDIFVNPRFVNREGGNYHLSSNSACINAGWNSATGLSPVDIDGQSRILGGVIDMGADEYQPTGNLTSISGAKKATAGSWIEFTGDVVTASMGDAFYIETENRASGIRVEKIGHTLDRPMKAYVFGKIKTNADGEVYIEASIAEQKGSETGTVTPLALTDRALGGSTLGLQAGVKDGAGLNNIGLLVRVCGKVVEIDQSATPTWFVIDDGSNAAVKCIIPSGVTIDTSSERVCVIGISSCEKVGAELHRIIRVRDAKDIASY